MNRAEELQLPIVSEPLLLSELFKTKSQSTLLLFFIFYFMFSSFFQFEAEKFQS